MKKSNTSERLKQIMKDRNLRQVDILEKAKPYCDKYNIRLGRNDLSQYVSGKVIPGQDKLTILGLALNVTETWLMGYDVSQEREERDSQKEAHYNLPKDIRPAVKRRYKYLGEIACGEPIFANEQYETFIDLESDTNADFVLKAKGDSMINARIQDGDMVFIKEQPDVNDGEIAAVIIDDEATLKRVYKYDDHISLCSENPRYKPINI
ncbi:MAG: hypothetical protein IKW21_08070, partial [Lachnospiraceae bacterium]|nr:hypothetical protein [Lachnospiraceae bacterium]